MASLGASTPEEHGVSSLGLQRVDEFIGQAIASKALAGAVVLVARDGQVIHRSVQGLKDLASQEPLSEETIFRIFSMTKPITAAAMMVLFEEGRWCPEDAIAKHLPEFAGVKGPDGGAPEHPPTMGELMTHTAGFGYGIGPGPHDAIDKAYISGGIWQAADLVEFSRLTAMNALAYQPGSRWRYSLSMDLQGAVIERLSAMSLPDFMRAKLFRPLQMMDTDFYVPEEKLSRLATLYHMYGATELTVLDHPGFVRSPGSIPKLPSGGGGLYATASDYMRFAQMLLNQGELDGARVLQPASVGMMTQNHLSQALLDEGFDVGMQKIGAGRGYGFNGAVFIDPDKAGSPVGRGTYQWDGAAGTWFWIDPEHQLVFVGMIQRMLQEGMVRLQEGTQALMAEALL